MTDTAWGLLAALLVALFLLALAVDLLLDRRAELHHKDQRIADLQDDVQQALRRKCMHVEHPDPSWVGPRPTIPTQPLGGNQ